VLEEEARNIIAQVENAKSRVYSVSKGFKRQLRIGLPDGLIPPQLAQLLARSREEEPATEIRIHNMAFHELYPALRRGQIDAGFTLDAREHPEGVVRIEAWRERPAALPIRHPLLFCEKVSFHEALHYPLITYHPERCAGAYRTMKRWLGKIARGRVPYRGICIEP
jgi:DNA-binding transcriptional LysR family regulator